MEPLDQRRCGEFQPERSLRDLKKISIEWSIEKLDVFRANNGIYVFLMILDDVRNIYLADLAISDGQLGCFFAKCLLMMGS